MGPDGEVVAEAQHDVVPAVRDDAQRQVGEVGVLVDEECAHEGDADVDLGGGGGHRVRLAVHP